MPDNLNPLDLKPGERVEVLEWHNSAGERNALLEGIGVVAITDSADCVVVKLDNGNRATCVASYGDKLRRLPAETQPDSSQPCPRCNKYLWSDARQMCAGCGLSAANLELGIVPRKPTLKPGDRVRAGDVPVGAVYIHSEGGLRYRRTATGKFAGEETVTCVRCEDSDEAWTHEAALCTIVSLPDSPAGNVRELGQLREGDWCMLDTLTGDARDFASGWFDLSQPVEVGGERFCEAIWLRQNGKQCSMEPTNMVRHLPNHSPAGSGEPATSNAADTAPSGSVDVTPLSQRGLVPDPDRWKDADPADIPELERRLAAQVASGGLDCKAQRSLMVQAMKLAREEREREVHLRERRELYQHAREFADSTDLPENGAGLASLNLPKPLIAYKRSR